MVLECAASLAISALAFCVHLYRLRFKQAVSPDGKFYLAMEQRQRVPQPYSRRWLLPMVLKSKRAWAAASGIAFLATGPLVYALTGSLACVWFAVWLPGIAIAVRFPVLTDAVALALMLAAVVAYKAGLWWVAFPLLFVAGQCKEVAPIFGVVLCPPLWPAAVLALVVALVIGDARSVPGDQEYMLHPFRVAMGKHDPLCWRSMLLPWGGVFVVGVAMAGTGLELEQATVVAGLSLVLGYGQLALANDEGRLFVWAAPAVLCWVAPYQGAWLVPALVVHPWVCGATRRV